MSKKLYDVTTIEIGWRYVGEVPVQCLTFRKSDGVSVTVRLTDAQMDDLADRIRLWRNAHPEPQGMIAPARQVMNDPAKGTENAKDPWDRTYRSTIPDGYNDYY